MCAILNTALVFEFKSLFEFTFISVVQELNCPLLVRRKCGDKSYCYLSHNVIVSMLVVIFQLFFGCLLQAKRSSYVSILYIVSFLAWLKLKFPILRITGTGKSNPNS